MITFELNTMTLIKFGWTSTQDDYWGFHRKNLPKNAIWFFEKQDPFLAEPITYFITNEYRFISHRTSKPGSTQKIEMIDDIEIKSNVELFKKIIETEACVESYARHFKINKLFK
jgi:hypothetical protein